LQLHLVMSVAPADEKDPEEHDVQTDDDLAAAWLEKDPAAHSVHAADPLVSFHDPAAHAEQGPPSGPP